MSNAGFICPADWIVFYFNLPKHITSRLRRADTAVPRAYGWTWNAFSMPEFVVCSPPRHPLNTQRNLISGLHVV